MRVSLTVLHEVCEVHKFDEMHNVDELQKASVLHEGVRSVEYMRLIGRLVVNVCPPSCVPQLMR